MRALLLAALLSVAGATAAIACSCHEYANAAEQAARADALFRGRAIDARELDGGWRITTFAVIAPLKLPDDAADANGNIQVRHHPVSSSSCGISFEPGEETLVVATLVRGELYTNYCRHPRFSEEEFRAALNLP